MSNGTSRLTKVAAVFFLSGVILGAAVGPRAWAGQYHVYSCRTPDGQVAPVDGWSESTKGSTSKGPEFHSDGCATGGGLVAALGIAKHSADKDSATWAFSAPASETLAAATLWRAGDALGGANVEAEASYMFWLAGVADSGSSTQVFQECAAIYACSSEGNFTNPLAANNHVEVPDRALHSPYLYLTASCGSTIVGSECPAGAGDENGNAAVIELFAADLVLNDEGAPTIGEMAGPLAEASTVSGTTDVSLTADDSASGVYEAIFQVDGETIQKTVLDANGGKCHDVGETTDGLPAFLYTRPCPPSASVDVPFDTTGLAEGSHHIVVSVTDAAGNATPAVDRQVTVANHPTSPGASAAGAASPAPLNRGAANGNGASDQATLTARWKGAGASLRSAYGKAHTLEGRLSAPGGAAIAGASIDVSDLPAAAGAHAAGLPPARTDVAGRFTLRLPRTLTSGTLRLGYRSHLADTTPVATRTLTLAVTPTLQLRVSPTVSAIGHTIHFRGRVLGGAIPPGGKQLVLEGRSPGTRWIQFETVRTNPRGAFHASYRFRLPGPVSFTFRVLSSYEADYPFLAGSSNEVGVLER
jgi:hypothetical protein